MRYSSKQAEVLLNADARWNILCGAVRSGKTWVSYDLMLQRLAELPDGDRVMIGRTQQTLERNVLNPMRRILGGSQIVSHINSKNTVYIAGKPFYVVGADNKEAVTKIQGLGLVYAYGDEVTTWHESVFQMLKSRLSDKGALFDGTCNPENPLHWLKRDILDRTDLSVKQWHFVIDDNPFLPTEYVENLKKEYTGVFYSRYILGQWVRAEGIIYDMFDAHIHVVPSAARVYTKYYVSCDYGTQNPTVFGLWGLCDGVWYKVKEYYYSGREQNKQRTDRQFADDYQAFVKGFTITAVIVDPSAASFIAELKQRNLPVIPADNAVLDGIRLTGSLLESGKIKICDCCKQTIKDFSLYVWDEKSLSEDKPIKDNDHTMDETRYFCKTILSGKGQMRFA